MSIQSRMTNRGLLFFFVALLVLGVLAWGGPGVWAAPNSQGTAGPTPPSPLGPLSVPLVFSVGGGATISVTADLTITVPPADAPIGTQVVVTPINSILPQFFQVQGGRTITPTTGLTITVPISTVTGTGTGFQQYAYRAHAYTVGLIGPDGRPITGVLNSPLNVAIRYNADDLAAAGGDPNNLVIMLFDPATGLWTPLPTFEIDPVTGWVRARIVNLPPGAVIALFAKTP